MNTSQLQMWIVDRGGNIRIDGQFGPKTCAALIGCFNRTDAPAITDLQLRVLASRLGCTIRQIKAVAAVESSGGGWDNTGQLKCLYERHYAWRRIQLKVPLLSDPKPGGYTLDSDRDGVNDSWEKIADATARWGDQVAFECASFGKFQIMGAWWKKLKYQSAIEFAYGMAREEFAHYEAFARYIAVFGLSRALQAVDGNAENCRAIAKGYNGSAYAKHNYHGRIAAAYRAAK